MPVATSKSKTRGRNKNSGKNTNLKNPVSEKPSFDNKTDNKSHEGELTKNTENEEFVVRKEHESFTQHESSEIEISQSTELRQRNVNGVRDGPGKKSKFVNGKKTEYRSNTPAYQTLNNSLFQKLSHISEYRPFQLLFSRYRVFTLFMAVTALSFATRNHKISDPAHVW